MTPTLPELSTAPALSLIAAIHASQRPTTNLEHLSEALDELGPENEVYIPLSAASQPLRSPEPALPIHHRAAGSTEIPEPPDLGARPTSRRPLVLFLVLLAALGLWGGLRWYKQNPIIIPKLVRAAPQKLGPAPPEPEPPAPGATPKPGVVTAPISSKVSPTDLPHPVAPKPAAKSPTVPSKVARLQAILDGNWKLTLAQGIALRNTLQGKWSLRLEIACQGTTVQRAAGLLKGLDPDLFILPMAMRDGRTCYQVFLGNYDTEAAALAAVNRLPSPFLAEGNRPQPFRVAQIPDRQ